MSEIGSGRFTGMGGHQSARALKDEWLTPPHVLRVLGDFDLDPCAPVERPWDMAAHHYTIEDNGLRQPWFGRVWCNPPYGKEVGRWLNRLADHGDGIALTFARTETDMFVEQVWRRADALLFLFGRLYFHHVDGRQARANSGAPSVLVAYGGANAECLRHCGLPGAFVPLNKEDHHGITSQGHFVLAPSPPAQGLDGANRRERPPRHHQSPRSTGRAQREPI